MPGSGDPDFADGRLMAEDQGATARLESIADIRHRIEGAAGSAPSDFSTSELDRLVASAADWLWETGSDLRFSWVSSQFRTVTGIDPAEVIGRFRFDFMDRALAGSRSAADHLADLEARRSFRNFVFELKGGPEACRWVSISGFPRHSSDGTFLG